ncbi:MAG: hypothetical protein HY941_03440 [Gammaproteobacteria bacterium]|nr:hypothetical protein [Gammaproteobacteria bacterium]
MSSHLAVAISAHGFGHGAQTTAVLAALRARQPALRLTLLTGLSRTFLHDRIPGDFELIDWRGDFGMQMRSALDVDLARSAADYASFHSRWAERLDTTARLLEGLAPDLLLANIPYLPLAAAAHIGLPSVALCSLNWAGIYRHYFAACHEAPAILAAMENAYNSAQAFLCPAPSMAMPELRNVQPIGPLAHVGNNVRAELYARLNVPESQRLVLIAPGGIELRLPLEDWPAHPDIAWIVPDAWQVRRRDMWGFEALGFAFTDVLASVDALLGKLGYGTVAECACNATPLLYMPRPDWPEERFLAEWLHAHGRCAPIERKAVLRGDVREALEALWASAVPNAPQPTGATDAASALVAMLDIN